MGRLRRGCPPGGAAYHGDSEAEADVWGTDRQQDADQYLIENATTKNRCNPQTQHAGAKDPTGYHWEGSSVDVPRVHEPPGPDETPCSEDGGHSVSAIQGATPLRTKKWERFLRLKEAKKARKAQPAETSQQYRLAKHLGPIRTNSSPPPFTTKEEPMETDAKGNETLPSFETWSIRVVRAETPPTSSSKSCRHHSQRKRRRKASLSSGRPHPLHQGKSKRIGQYLLMLYPAVWLGGGV
uniref:Uncharacterized protein n=1 Tax=Sipha flava TaxID=143950 RepID=A0A2S2R6S8_9HEMI